MSIFIKLISGNLFIIQTYVPFKKRMIKTFAEMLNSKIIKLISAKANS